MYAPRLISATGPARIVVRTADDHGGLERLYAHRRQRRRRRHLQRGECERGRRHGRTGVLVRPSPSRTAAPEVVSARASAPLGEHDRFVVLRDGCTHRDSLL